MNTEIDNRVRSFVNAAIAQFGEDLRCVVLTGSYARNEARPQSDIDLWVFFTEVRREHLTGIATILGRTTPGPEIIAQCTSFSELRTNAFRDQFSPIQLYADGLVLHGALETSVPTHEQIRHHAGAIAAHVLMSARHYITAQEPELSLSSGKLQKWVLKPLMWALRYEVLTRTDSYPRALEDLAASAFSTDAARTVECYASLLAGTFSGPYMQEIFRAESVSQELMLRCNRSDS